MNEWLKDGRRNGWVMPCAPTWKRLPIIRHVRALVLSERVAKHNAAWLGLGFTQRGYDAWVLRGIWLGMERKKNGDAT
jgi:hypothetical protein